MEASVRTKVRDGGGDERGARRVVTSICGICPGGCGVDVELVDGKINRLVPLKDHPLGILCVRGVHAKEIVYSPDRVLYPMQRAGAKGPHCRTTVRNQAHDGSVSGHDLYRSRSLRSFAC